VNESQVGGPVRKCYSAPWGNKKEKKDVCGCMCANKWKHCELLVSEVSSDGLP